MGLATTREEMPGYACRIPENVKEIRTLYLGDAAFKKSGRKIRLTKEEKETLKGLLSGSVDAVNWTGVLDLAKQHHQHMSDFLMSESFFDVCMEEYHRQNSKKVFLQFLWNFRGIYFPLMYILSQEIPRRIFIMLSLLVTQEFWGVVLLMWRGFPCFYPNMASIQGNERRTSSVRTG